MKAIILSGHTHKGPHPALSSENGRLKIDIFINGLKKLNINVVIVLGDQFSDEILQSSELVRTCELVFDTNGIESTKLTNLKAGALLVKRECLILPITSVEPAVDVVNKLNHHYFTKAINLEKQVVRPYSPNHGQMTPSEYFMITPYGLKFISRLDQYDQLETPEMVSAVPVIGTQSDSSCL